MTISSLGGLSEDDDKGPPLHLSRREIVVALLQAGARLLVGLVFILWLMSLAPKTAEDSALYPALLAAAGIAIYVTFFVRQIRGVYKARYPTVRAAEALVLTAAMFLAIFSMVYVTISLRDPSSFTEPLDSFSAYYYALTVLATVGFGDIAPTNVPARSVTMVQMALDIAFIAVLIRVMGGAAKKALQLRADSQHGQQGAGGGAA
jgi:voltage-gated potassium channel